MAQDLTVNIRTTSDVPQAMDKSKSAVVSFSKQVEDVQKKFSTTFKDVFLSFLGPMALVTGAISIISKMIAESQRKQEEATRAAIDGTNELMSAEDRYWARKKERENQTKENIEQAKVQRIAVTEEFLSSEDPRASEILKRETERLGALAELQGGAITPYGLARDPKVQEEVQKIIAEEAAKEQPQKPAGVKDGQFKGPEGFGNVIGVGANPVMEAMTRQTEVLEEIKAVLEASRPSGGGVPVPFTEGPASLRREFTT
jgi:hypothetical protein